MERGILADLSGAGEQAGEITLVTTAPTTISDRIRRLTPHATCCRRIFWVCLLLLHVLGIRSALASLGHGPDFAADVPLLVRACALLVSACFFVLKILDVACLRLKPGWRGGVVALVIVAVIHVGVVDRAMSGELTFDSTRVGLVFFAGTLWQVDAIRRGLRLALAILVPVRLQRSRRSRDRLGYALEATLRPFDGFYIPSFTGPRAPPLL